MYYNGAATDPSTMRYSSEEEEEEEEEEEDETSYSENSDYSTEEETTEDPRDGSDSGGDVGLATTELPDYTDLSEAVPKDSAATAERREAATRGVVPVDPVFVGCGDDCATTGGLESASPADGDGRVDNDGEGSSSGTTTTDSAFGEIIKASLGEVTTL